MIKTTAQKIYLGLIFIFLYAPIITLIVLSFNASKTRAKWGGFTTKWYAALFQNEQIMQALWNTLALAVLSITLSAVIVLSPWQPIVHCLAVLYRLPLFIPFIVAAQMMRTFLAKNGLMNNVLVAAGLMSPLDTASFLGWKGIIITFVWKQMAFILF